MIFLLFFYFYNARILTDDPNLLFLTGKFNTNNQCKFTEYNYDEVEFGGVGVIRDIIDDNYNLAKCNLKHYDYIYIEGKFLYELNNLKVNNISCKDYILNISSLCINDKSKNRRILAKTMPTDKPKDTINNTKPIKTYKINNQKLKKYIKNKNYNNKTKAKTNDTIDKKDDKKKVNVNDIISENYSKHCLLLEIMELNLYDFIYGINNYIEYLKTEDNITITTEQLKNKIIKDLVHGLICLGNSNIVHRDLNPNNILVAYRDNNIIAKISDFGESINIKEDYTNYITELVWNVYRSKEYATNPAEHYNDYYAMGCIIYFIINEKDITKDIYKQLEPKLQKDTLLYNLLYNYKEIDINNITKLLQKIN